MEKLKMHSSSATNSRFEIIASNFPECITEAINANGEVTKAVDFAKLKELLGCSIVDEDCERYCFTWPQKAASARLADSRTSLTLRPCPEESINYETTSNLYIEGDNLDVLKVIRNAYRGRVKMIYIDPPYNTGNDFVYADDFAQSPDEYRHSSNQLDDCGNRLVKNMDSNGRFHTDWLNMIYPRLKVARELLTDDGVIFISIDDHEADNLKKVCCELFGDQNFVAQFIWQRAYSPKNDSHSVSVSHDYVLMLAKNIDRFQLGLLPRSEKANARYKNPDNDPRGPWKPSDMSVKTYSASNDYPITTPSGRVVSPPNGRSWSISQKSFETMKANNEIWFGTNGNAVPSIKRFLSDLKKDGMTPTSLLMYNEVGHSQEAAQDLKALMGSNVFDGPKPLRLLKHLMCIANLGKDDIVLDFFGGSSSTAHALMEYNLEQNTSTHFITVQLPEKTSDKKLASKAGYQTITEIGKERLRRAGEAIQSKLQEMLSASSDNDGDSGPESKPVANNTIDTGFRVLKLDSSNMQDAYYLPQELSLATLVEDNIKPDRSAEDLLFQCLLETDVLLSSPIAVEMIAGKQVFEVNGGYLMACFDEDIDIETIKAIALKKPAYFITRDAAQQSDDVADNLEQVFNAFSSSTIIKVI